MFQITNGGTGRPPSRLSFCKVAISMSNFTFEGGRCSLRMVGKRIFLMQRHFPVDKYCRPKFNEAIAFINFSMLS